MVAVYGCAGGMQKLHECIYGECFGAGKENISTYVFIFLTHTSTCIYRFHTKQFLPPSWKHPPFSLLPTSTPYDFIHRTLVFYYITMHFKNIRKGMSKMQGQ